jgi:hypothetical protein
LGHTGGRLRASIVVEEDSDGWIIGTNMPYAEFVELGVNPHSVEPNNKQALKFYSPKTGEFVFSKGHMVSGFPGRRMFNQGIDFFDKYMNEHSIN